MKTLSLLILLAIGAASVAQAQERAAEELFFEANVRMAEEAYAEAASLYEAALDQRPSANLHHNLGTAYYRLENWGKARFHWERALAMDPGRALAKRQLQTLLDELNLAESAPGFWTRAALVFSFNRWIWIGAVSFWLLPFSLVAWKWKKKGWLAVPAGLGVAGLAIATAALLIVNPLRDQAIVLDAEAALRVAPTLGSPVAAALRPGQRVSVVEDYGDFSRVLLENGTEGYVPMDQLGKIWAGS